MIALGSFGDLGKFIQAIADASAGLDSLAIRGVGQINKGNLIILLVVNAPSGRFILVLEPMAANELRMKQSPSNIVLVTLRACVLIGHGHQPRVKQAAVERPEMELADNERNVHAAIKLEL